MIIDRNQLFGRNTSFLGMYIFFLCCNVHCYATCIWFYPQRLPVLSASVKHISTGIITQYLGWRKIFFANHKHLVILRLDSDLQLCSMSLGYECSAATKSLVPSVFCRNVLKRLLMSSINPKNFLLFFSVCWATFQFYYPHIMSEQAWTQKCWWRVPLRSQTDQMVASSCHSLLSMPVIGGDPKQNRVNWALYQPWRLLLK